MIRGIRYSADGFQVDEIRKNPSDAAKSVLFNTSNGYAYKNTDTYDLEFFTMSGLYYWYGGSSTQQIFKYGNGGYQSNLTRSGIISFDTYNVSWNGTTTVTGSMPKNKWVTLTFVCNSTEIKIFLEGILLAKATVSKATFPNTVFSPMSYVAGAFRGNITQVRVWNRAFTNKEANDLAIYNKFSRSGLVGEWLCNEGEGTTLYDTSGSGENLALTNGPVWSTNIPFGVRTASTGRTTAVRTAV